MVYKFNGDNSNLEIQEISFTTISLSIIEIEGKSIRIELNNSQIYDLIGCLHSLKGKLDKYEKEGKNNG